MIVTIAFKSDLAHLKLCGVVISYLNTKKHIHTSCGISSQMRSLSCLSRRLTKQSEYFKQ